MTPKHILLIDDDPDEFEFFQMAIDKMPGLCKCSYAITPDEAFKFLNRAMPDYIFLDMNMPAMNGLECLAKLREAQMVDNVPVYIYTTGYTDLLKIMALKAGASGCMRKPDAPIQLTNMIQRLLTTGRPEVN